VQGVGFRPFVYRLAKHFGLNGWVRNCDARVEIHCEGGVEALDIFGSLLHAEAPAISQLTEATSTETEPEWLTDFCILQSVEGLQDQIHVPPDYFCCDDCLKEMEDPADRRYRYPFINCTQCGPRYTLIERLPYDRRHTTMVEFILCPACQAEYDNPLSRRFHAEPTACPICGPQLELQPVGKPSVMGNEAALAAASRQLEEGNIVAVKGVGGYHLMCDASNEDAVSRLRVRKHRPHKPLAVMYPAAPDLELLHLDLLPNAIEKMALLDPLRPIVLIGKHRDGILAKGIAPHLGEIGAVLAYSPLHHLLLKDFGKPLVATSANISGEPVLTDAHDVETRLAHVADAFLHHDRPIQRPADDSVLRIIAGKARVVRLGRGYSPLEFELPRPLKQPVLAVGAQDKNTIGLGWGRRAVISPHIGNLGSPRSIAVFNQVITDLCELYRVTPQGIVCDAHPDYNSTRWAARSGLPVMHVLHHHAHASALAGEFHEQPNWLMLTWDGIGYGADKTLWGGETLIGSPGSWRRVATWLPYHLAGGARAIREPWRSAATLCWEAGQDWQNAGYDATLPKQAWQRRVNAPVTSSVGRLFDAAASLLGLVQESSFEGQAPMWLEAASGEVHDHLELPLRLRQDGILECDWKPLLLLLNDATLGIAQRGGLFHSTLAHAALQQAKVLREKYGAFSVGLSGGVFQNRLLAEKAVSLLEAAKFKVFLPYNIPCNDGGISFGQLVEASASHE
jgi:hydrogenase maturation protein HypF